MKFNLIASSNVDLFDSETQGSGRKYKELLYSANRKWLYIPLIFSVTIFPIGSLTPLSASQMNLASSFSDALEMNSVPFISKR